MQTNKSWIDSRLLQFLQALMPKSGPAKASGAVRRKAPVRLNRVHPGMALLHHLLEAERGVPRESSKARRRGTPIRVLIVVDDPKVRDAYQGILRETSVSSDIAVFREPLSERTPRHARESSSANASRRMTSFEPICCNRAEEAVTRMRQASVLHQPYAVAFIDVTASSCAGVRTAIRIREMDPDVEIVLLTGCAEIDPLEIGGVLPPEEKLSYLPRSARPGEVRQMIIALSSKWLAERRIVRVAYFDSLTQLPNWEQFRHRLSDALEIAKHQNRPLGLLYLNLDKFKGVNDTLGHAAGDELLRAVACRLRDNLRFERSLGFDSQGRARPGDLARLGGDEFVAMLPGLRTISDAALVAERLIQAIREPVRLAGNAVVVTPSVGIAIYPKDATNSQTLLRNADAAMYFAKRRSRGSYAFFDPGMNAAVILPFPTAELCTRHGADWK